MIQLHSAFHSYGVVRCLRDWGVPVSCPSFEAMRVAFGWQEAGMGTFLYCIIALSGAATCARVSAAAVERICEGGLYAFLLLRCAALSFCLLYTLWYDSGLVQSA